MLRILVVLNQFRRDKNCRVLIEYTVLTGILVVAYVVASLLGLVDYVDKGCARVRGSSQRRRAGGVPPRRGIHKVM